jgi:hypothetical protein
VIWIGRQYSVCLPQVVQYHPVGNKKVYPFNNIMRSCIMSPPRSTRAAGGH